MGEKNTLTAGGMGRQDKDDNTFFVNCEAWGRLSNTPNIKKGDRLVFGQIRGMNTLQNILYACAGFVQYIGSTTEMPTEPQNRNKMLSSQKNDDDLPFLITECINMQSLAQK